LTHNSPSNAVSGTTIYNYTSNDYASYNGVRCGNIIRFERRVIPSGKLQQDKVFLQQVLLLPVFNNGMRVSGGASGLKFSVFKTNNTKSKGTNLR
jgi:hypothetical protein